MPPRVLACLVAVSLSAAIASSQPIDVFKLGSFEQGGRTFLGLVLRDALVLDLSAANAAYEHDVPSAIRLNIPSDMKTLIGQYAEGTMEERLRAISHAAATPSRPPAYARDLKAVRTRPRGQPHVRGYRSRIA